MSTQITRRDMMKALGLGTLAVSLGCATGHADQDMGAAAVPGPGGEYKLPPLPYDYGALEPAVSERILRIHHDRHHAGYVAGLNSTLQTLKQARQEGDFADIKPLSRALAFNGSGHIFHTIYWNSMTPGGTEAPGPLAAALKASFGSVDAALKQFAAATKTVEASGWGVLAWEPLGRQLLILQATKHQNLTMWGVIPIMVCDVWEHAYYLQYQNNRGTYVDNFMKIVDWQSVGERLELAQKVNIEYM